MQSSVKQAQLGAVADGDRLTAARTCLDGRCKEMKEEKVMCIRQCGRGVHLVSCLRTSKDYGAAGRLICVSCRLWEILEDTTVTVPAALTQQVTLGMVAELTSGAVSTAAGRNQYVSLERKWVMETTGGSGSPISVKPPRHSIESFIAFIWWLVIDADRARSFSTPHAHSRCGHDDAGVRGLDEDAAN